MTTATIPPRPRIKLYKRRIRIDHPDPLEGERLLADALGAVDRDALEGLLKQLVKASVIGQKPDEANLAFMISMIRSIAPRDSIEAMLVAQMVCIHALTMRCAHRLAFAGDLERQDSASRALAKLARIFPSQIEALNRYRNNGERAITVQSLPAREGGNATRPAGALAARPETAGDTGLIPPLDAGERDLAEVTQGGTA
ncbi:hypothetical protein JQ625_08000 [Bradyrhizobium diazoefficiens]|nr:hypothetical protein [Bradyrhizobium diazoefficiens]MBR0774769.1 hypothetical protein [Bradyrhizobium diazoefficiens]